MFFQILKNFTSVHLSYVELKQMGQQVPGSYPVHFHLCGDVDEKGGYTYRTYIEGLSIHHCFSRCVSIHATNGLLVRAMNKWKVWWLNVQMTKIKLVFQYSWFCCQPWLQTYRTKCFSFVTSIHYVYGMALLTMISSKPQII